MAITIVNSPASGSTVQDDLWHIASSTNSADIEFKYVFDVYVNGTQKIRVRQFADPTTLRGYFNAGNVVRNSMTYNWFEPVSDFVVDQPNVSGEVGVTYQVRYGEELSGITTVNMASGNTTAYNFNAPLLKRRLTSLSDKSNKWLTNRPNYATTDAGEKLFIGMYLTGSKTINVKTYDASNSLVQSANVSKSAGFYQLNIGSAGIMQGFGVDVTNSKYYTIDIDGLETFTVTNVCNPKYAVTNVHFLNAWGVYDSLRFDLASRLSFNATRKDFQQQDYRFGASDVTYLNGNRYYEGTINYFNTSTFKNKLTASVLTDAEYQWAADLILSPQILMEIDSYFYPATISNSTYTFNKYVNDRLKPLEVEFEFNSLRNSQLR
jgi:hypothetical protein